MRPLKIVIWHIHGSYLNALARLPHTFYLPTKPDRPEGYGGRGRTFDLPPSLIEVPAEAVCDLNDVDLVLYQTPGNYFTDGPAILSERQQRLPRIYLEHNTPRTHPVEVRHPLADEGGTLLVHVTHFNRLMWDNGAAPTRVIEHSVAIDPRAAYTGERAAGITVVNSMGRRPRIAGRDLFEAARAHVPLDIAGMETEELGGLGDIPYRDLHRRMGEYRFLFSPLRYTSLPLAVIEAMTLGMPVVALATTELPTVIQHGTSGIISCDPAVLLAGMRHLLADAAAARRMGDNARQIAQERFGMPRFIRDWEAAFAHAMALR